MSWEKTPGKWLDVADEHVRPFIMSDKTLLKRLRADYRRTDEVQVGGEVDSPEDVIFDTSLTNFDGEYPVLEIDGTNIDWDTVDGIELRYGSSWLSGTVIHFLEKKDTKYKWTKYKAEYGSGGGRNITIWAAARDKFNVYSDNPDSISLVNSAPSMSGFSPIITFSKRDKVALVDWSAWTGLTATDLDGFKVYRSTEAVCTISDTNLVDKAGKASKTFKITGLTKGLTYDIRVNPCDTFGDGTPSD